MIALSSRSLVRALLLLCFAVAACSRTPPGEPDPTVAITQPNDGQQILLTDDEDLTVPGVQFTVKAHITDVTDRATASLLIDGSAVAGLQQALTAGASDISFAKATLPAGSHSIAVKVDDAANGKSALDIKSVTVQGGASCSFVKPQSTTLHAADDELPATAQVETQVVVHCPGIASGTAATLQVAVLLGNQRQELAPLSASANGNGDITFDQAPLGEGQNAVIFGAGNGAYSAQETLTVDTGSCPVVLGEPGGTIYNVAGGAPTDPGDARAAQADADTATAGIQASFTAYTDTAACPAGSTATLLINGVAAGTATVGSDGKASFTHVTLPDGDPVTEAVQVTGSSKSGTSAANAYGVDSVVPQLAINHPSAAVLTPADDLDPSTSGLQTQVGIHATAGIDAATQVSVVDNGGASPLIAATTGLTLDGNGDYLFPQQVTLPSGSNALVATATRRLGNVGTATFTTNVTQSSLAISLINPADTTVTCTHAPGDSTDEDLGTPDCDLTMLVQLDASATTVDFAGSANVTGGQTGVAPDASHQASVQFHIPQGDAQTLTATAHDATGATQSVTVTVSVHTVGPEISITSPTVADSPLGGQQQTVTVHVTGAAANEQVVLTSDTGTGSPQTLGTQSVSSVDGSGAADVTFSNVQLPLGSQTLTATITDAFENAGTASVAVTVLSNGQCDITIQGGSPQVFNLAGTVPGSGGARTATLSGATTQCMGFAVTIDKVVGNGAPTQVASTTADASTGAFSVAVPFSDNEIDAQLIAHIGAGSVQGQATVTYTADFTPPSFDTLVPAAGAVKIAPNGDARDGSNGFVADADAATAGGQFAPNIVVSGAGKLGAAAETGTGSLVISGGGLAAGTGLPGITDNGAQTFTSQLSFTDGAARTVTLTATDAAGNVATQTWSVAVASKPLPAITMVDPSGTLNVLSDLRPFHTDHIDYHGYVTFSAQIAAGTELYICTTTASPGASTACQLASPAGTKVPGSSETFGGSGPAPATSAFWADLPFPEGSFQVFAEAVSAIGDVADSATKNVTVDSVPPVVTAVTITEDTDANHVLNQAEVSAAGGTLHVHATFTGVEDGRTATLSFGSQQATATVSGGAASFPAPTSALTDGTTYSFKVTVKDAANNPNETTQTSPPITNATDSYSLKLSSALPSLSVLSPSSTLCNASSSGANVANDNCAVTFTVSVAGEDGNAITNVTFTGPGAPGSPNDVVVPDANGHASAAYVVPAGANQVLTATATDTAGNTASVSVTLTVDVTAPALTLSAPATSSQQDFTVTVSTSASDVSAVSVLSGAQVIGTGSFSGGSATVSVHAPIGSDVLIAKATDASGNPGTSNAVTVNVSQAGCDIQFTNPAGATVAINAASPGSPPNKITVTGNSTQCANTAITFTTSVNGGAATPVAGTYTTDASGNFSVPVTLQDGATTVFTAQMTSGTTTTASFTATVDVTTPTIQVTAPSAGVGGTLYVVARSGNRHVAAADQGYVADASPLTGGQVSVSLSVTGGGSASGSGNGTLLVTDKNGSTLASQSIASNGSVQFSPSGTPLVFTLPQAYQGAVNFKVTDAAGNTATATWPSVAVDVVAPPAPALVTTDPGDGHYTHVVNERHADLEVSFTKPTDDGLPGQDVTLELGYSTSTRLDGGAYDETAYANSAVTTLVPVTTAPVVNASLTSVPPLNTYYVAPRALDSVGNVSAFASTGLDVNWTRETLTYQGSNSSSAFFGAQLSVGDIDGDGAQDVAVYAVGDTGFKGAVTIFYGGPFPLTRTQNLSGAGLFYGQGLTLGDVNGDGLSDLILINSDRAEIYLANTNGLENQPSFVISGDSALYTIGVLPDLNGDGINELLLVSPTTDGGGTAYIFFGKSNWAGFGGTTSDADVVITESASGAKLGGLARGTAALPDIDGDGVPELFLGEPGVGKGLVFESTQLLARGSGTVSDYVPIVINAPGTSFGDVAVAWDLNSDGIDDLVSGTQSTSGSLFKSLQTPLGTFSAPVAVASGPNYYARAMCAGDVNLDASPDLFVGVGGNAAGLIQGFFSGSSLSQPGALIHGSNGFGNAVAVGDVNNDGKPDLIVSEPGVGNGTVYVYH